MKEKKLIIDLRVSKSKKTMVLKIRGDSELLLEDIFTVAEYLESKAYSEEEDDTSKN